MFFPAIFFDVDPIPSVFTGDLIHQVVFYLTSSPKDSSAQPFTIYALEKAIHTALKQEYTTNIEKDQRFPPLHSQLARQTDESESRAASLPLPTRPMCLFFFFFLFSFWLSQTAGSEHSCLFCSGRPCEQEKSSGKMTIIILLLFYPPKRSPRLEAPPRTEAEPERNRTLF